MEALADSQLGILRHMLGIDNDGTNPPYRNYYCANPGDAALHELMNLGAVRMHAVRDGYEWFTTTEAGRQAAIASRPKCSPGRRRYYRWLSARDAHPDLTFRAFLTDPQWKDAERGA